MQIKVRGISWLVNAQSTREVEFWDSINAGKERVIYERLEEMLQPGAWFVDIGAHLGCYSLWAAMRGHPVLAFEPDPVALAGLLGSIALLQPSVGERIAVETRAVGIEGWGDIYTPSRTWGDSKSRSTPTNARPIRVAYINLRRAMLNRDGWYDRPSPVVKIDCEGGEFDILDCDRSYIQRERPSLMLALHGNIEPELWEDRRAALWDTLSVYPHLSDENRHGYVSAADIGPRSYILAEA